MCEKVEKLKIRFLNTVRTINLMDHKQMEPGVTETEENL